MTVGLTEALLEWWDDERKRAFLLRWFWIVSLGMLLLGYTLIVLRFL